MHESDRRTGKADIFRMTSSNKKNNILREKPAWSFRETSGNVMSQMAMQTGGLKYGRFDHEREHITVGKSSQMLQKRT